MLDRMGPDQFNEWIAAYNLDPWGDDWMQAAQQIAAVQNAGGANPPVSAADIIPTRENMLKGGDEVPEEELASFWKSRLGA